MSLDDRNAELNKKLEYNPIDEQITVLVGQANRNKRNIKLLALSFLIELLLSCGLFYGWYQNHTLAIRAESNHNAIVRNCETGNEARANNKKLWDYILAIPSTEPTTPERDKRIADFRGFVDKTFAPRDCKSIK